MSLPERGSRTATEIKVEMRETSSRIQMLKGQISMLEDRERHLSRELARAEGRLADQLTDLNPINLNPNLEWVDLHRWHGFETDFKTALGYRPGEKSPVAEAYACRYCDGWVLGRPEAREYNTLMPSRLSGSAGIRFHCTVCGEKIGVLMGRVS